jgi:L-rhamnose mutarotase
MAKNITIFALFIINVYSCANSQINVKEDDDCLIINLIREEQLIEYMSPDAFLNNNPLSFFGTYINWKEKEEKTKNLEISLVGKIEWIFDEKDIEYMRKEYQKWRKDYWNDLCPEIKKLNLSNKSGAVITYPFYNKDKTKALISISPKGRGTKIILLKRNKKWWSIVGELQHSFN